MQGCLEIGPCFQHNQISTASGRLIGRTIFDIACHVKVSFVPNLFHVSISLKMQKKRTLSAQKENSIPSSGLWEKYAAYLRTLGACLQGYESVTRAIFDYQIPVILYQQGISCRLSSKMLQLSAAL